MITDFFDIFKYILVESSQTLILSQFVSILLILFLFRVLWSWLQF